MIDTQIRCDVCGIERQAVNHWYLVRANRSGFHVVKGARKPGDMDVCGQAHVHSLLDRWMETGSLAKPEVVHPETTEAEGFSPAMKIVEQEEGTR